MNGLCVYCETSTASVGALPEDCGRKNCPFREEVKVAERMPALIGIYRSNIVSPRVVLHFDADINEKYLREIEDLIKLKFAGQLRRDPDAPQTAPPPPEASS